MGAGSIIGGIVRRFTKVLPTGGRALRMTGLESLAVAQTEPLCFEGSRSARRFYLGYSAAPTGIAPVQALATTASHWTIWNGEPAGGKAYTFEHIGAYVTAGTPGVGGILWGTIFTAPASVGASSAGVAVQNASNGSLASKAIVKSSITITQPAAPIWFPVAENDSPNVGAFPGSGSLKNRDKQGRLVLAPQSGLGLYVLAPAGTTPLFAPWAVWCELEADLE